MVESGLFGSESLYVSFDFTLDAMLAAAGHFQEALRSGRSEEMPEEIKTYVHELTHYLQYTTTPYGLFLQYCRVMQSRVTIEIVSALVDAGIGFNIPLLHNVPNVTGETATTLQRGLSLWLNVENLLAMLHGNTDRRMELMQLSIADYERVAAGHPPRLPLLLDVREAFVRVQESMAEMLEQINADAHEAGNPIPMEPVGFDHDVLRMEKTEIASDFDRALLRNEYASDIVGLFNVEAIIEGAATAAEYWGSDISYDHFVAWANAEVDPKLRVYRTCLAQGLSAIPTRQLPEFIPSFMTLCELALFAPVLPHHAALRRQHPDFRQIPPTFRWMELIRAASHVEPMRANNDHGRYVTDLCKKLGWVHPFQIIKIAMDAPSAVSNPLAMIYLSAQRWRARSSGAFLGAHRFLFDPSPEAEAWRSMFNFVILDYADRTTYHRDKEFLKAMTTRRLNMLGMRCIMIGDKSLTIRAPYRGNAAERSWMTEWLRERFKTVFGFPFPTLQVV